MYFNLVISLLFSLDGAVIAKMRLLLDKASYEKGRSLDPVSNDVDVVADSEEQVKSAIRDTLAPGKVGNLNVDPGFLVFESHSCEYINILATVISSEVHKD